MRPTLSSTLWLELLGGLLIALGALVAWGALFIANHPPDPALSKNLLRVRVDLPGFVEGVASRLSVVGAVMAGSGAILFFGAHLLIRTFRAVLGLATAFALGVWLWIRLT
ncbi:hypothetical protein [Calidithermus roseus]|uniref:Uncharacterized protein n=1 Tax=Calidithermus roseus TaxID=1644118 RepID=A0A399ER75_9DEIN|nr:hypothetical protein [Calidithermus roseus]RIH84681.1 hypothetical protein Mrose_02529 [Calidithermus roseus]